MNLEDKHMVNISVYHRLPLSLFLLLFILSLVFFSCDRNNLFEANRNISNSSWNQQSPVTFPVLIKDTTTHFNILFNIRNEGNYPYSNLYLFVRVSSPSGSILIDTMDIDLADKQGKWYGTGLGDLSFLQVPYKTDIRFPVTGIYTFKITQGMRTPVLKGIRNVGIRIEKVKTGNSGQKK